jgi:tetratricopeptide (TPR) repeat protein
MKKTLLLLLITVSVYSNITAQEKPDYSKIDLMLVHGEYQKVIDTCRLILATDSLRSEIHYRQGLAWQNMMPDDNSFDCFLKASSSDTANGLYKYTVAKGYFNKNKNNKAKPILVELYASDTLNWSYAFYLTSIFMHEGRFDESIDIYNRFLRQDSSNYVFYDKLGYAYLRKNDYKTAIDYYNKSLELNEKNINAIKNLSFLLPYDKKTMLAVELLTKAIEMDPDDMDLYARRGTIYYAIDYNKRALNDYLTLLASGDSSFLYLKRAGAGYTNNFQPKLAIPLLIKASFRDTTDYETLDLLARNYNLLNDFKKSQYYYTKICGILGPLSVQLGVTHMMLAEEYKVDSLYKKAAENYVKAIELTHNSSINIMLANLYDELMGNPVKAIYYYKQFFSGIANAKGTFPADYIESLRKRLAYLEEKQKKPDIVKK